MKGGSLIMTTKDYKVAKLHILSKESEGLITESQRDELLTFLEAKKEESQLSKDDIKKFFKQLADQNPDDKDSIDEFAKKYTEKESEDTTSEEESNEDSSEGETTEESTNEYVEAIMADIEALANN